MDVNQTATLECHCQFNSGRTKLNGFIKIKRMILFLFDFFQIPDELLY